MNIVKKANQAQGAFNNGEIIENKPIGFPQDGGTVKPYSNLFYWANAEALTNSTIGLHPHTGFEIISFVLSGKIQHYDTKNKEWKPLEAGDVQIIRAGKGIQHAEMMFENSRMFQIWLDPNLEKTLNQDASYSDYRLDQLPISNQNGAKVTTYIGEGSPFELDTPGIEVIMVDLNEGSYTIEASDKQVTSIYSMDSTIVINEKALEADDFVIAQGERQVVTGFGRIFIIKSLKDLDYKTYAKHMMR